jgi:hypothetical protein
VSWWEAVVCLVCDYNSFKLKVIAFLSIQTVILIVFMLKFFKIECTGSHFSRVYRYNIRFSLPFLVLTDRLSRDSSVSTVGNTEMEIIIIHLRTLHAGTYLHLLPVTLTGTYLYYISRESRGLDRVLAFVNHPRRCLSH